MDFIALSPVPPLTSLHFTKCQGLIHWEMGVKSKAKGSPKNS